MAARRTAADADRAEAERFEAEAATVSAALDDGHLAAIIGRVGEGLAGPLATSPLAVTRAVVGWCRAAAAGRPGPFLVAVDAALTGSQGPTSEHHQPAALTLPAASPETSPLRERVGHLVRPAEPPLTALCPRTWAEAETGPWPALRPGPDPAHTPF
jgi:hypothetical protein